MTQLRATATRNTIESATPIDYMFQVKTVGILKRIKALQSDGVSAKVPKL